MKQNYIYRTIRNYYSGNVIITIYKCSFVVGAYAAGLGIGALSAHIVYKLTH